MENEIVNVISIPMPEHELIRVQRAATAQQKLVPDFIADAIRAAAAKTLIEEHEKRSYENKRAHRHGIAEGKADTIQAAYSLLRDHGHNEAADLLGKHFTTAGRYSAEPMNTAAAIEKALEPEVAAAEQF